jgi:hypothetical protein
MRSFAATFFLLSILTQAFSQAQSWDLQTLDSDASGLTLEFSLRDYTLENGTFEIASTAHAAEPGQPALPALSELIALPMGCDFRVEILQEEIEILEGVQIDAQEAWQSDRLDAVRAEVLPDASLYATDAFWPSASAELGAPALWHGTRVIGLTLYPAAWNPVTKQLKLRRRLSLRVHFYGTNPQATLAEAARSPRAGRQLVSSIVLNPERVHELMRLSAQAASRDGAAPLPSYLVLAPDAAYEYLLPWLEWKKQKGHPLRVILESELGGEPNFSALYDAVLGAHLDDPVDYLLLVGDIDRYPSGSEQDYNLDAGFIPGGGYAESQWGVRCNSPDCIVSDHLFSLLEGGDYFADLMVGRLSVDNANQLVTVVNKWVAYERDPYVADADWFGKALVIYDTAVAASRRETKLLARDLLYEKGFSRVDTVRNNYYWDPQPPSLITNIVNAGVSLVNYRGFGFRYQWAGPNFTTTHASNLTNYGRWPLVTSIVCGGGDFASSGSDPCFAEAWLRSGSPSAPAGAIGFIAPSEEDTHTKWNNTIDLGIYQGFAREGLLGVGELMDRGKLELWQAFPNSREWSTPCYNVPFYFHAYNLVGDPGMRLTTTYPISLSCELPESLPTGPLNFCTTVLDANCTPCEGIQACLYNAATSEQLLSTSSAQGEICFSGTDLSNGSSWQLTLHADGYAPFTQSLHTTNQASHLVPQSVEITDGTTEDGLLSVGERVGLSITLLEAGLSGLDIEQQVMLSTGVPELELHGNASLIPAMEAGQEITLHFDIELHPTVAEPFVNNQLLPLDLVIDGQNRVRIHVPVAALGFQILGLNFEGEAAPGATGQLLVELSFESELACESFSVCAFSTHLNLEFPGPCIEEFQLEPDGTATLDFASVHFAEDLLPGEEAPFSLEFEALSFGLALELNLHQSLIAGSPGIQDPAGPDAGGYVLYEAADQTYSEAPEAGFTSIASLGQELPIDAPIPDPWEWEFQDGITLVEPLPFTFNYWGEDFSMISICSNGWIAFGDYDYVYTAINTPIPGAQGAPAMVAPYWTNLYNYASQRFGHLYTWYDADQHRYLIEWNDFRPVSSTAFATFQLELRDPLYWDEEQPAGEIILRYDEVPHNPGENGATVGFESPDETAGLQLLFNEDMHQTLHEIEPGSVFRYMKHTSFTGLDEAQRPTRSELQAVWPNPFNPSTHIQFNISQASFVELAVFNLLGQQVTRLVKADLASGSHTLQFNGSGFESGIYFARLTVNGQPMGCRKMILMK